MRRTVFVAASTAVLFLSTLAFAEQSKVLNPIGTYDVSSSTDTGQPMTGTLVITAAASGYTGTFSSPQIPAPLPLVSVMTSEKQMMATINDGTNILLVWVDMLPDGTFKGTWHQLSPGIPATGKKK